MKPSDIRIEKTMASELVYPLRYIRFMNNTNQPDSQIELDEGVIVDVDQNGDIVGIEVI